MNTTKTTRSTTTQGQLDFVRQQQAERIEKLEKFVNQFLDAFETCEECNGSGWDELTQGNCAYCYGSGERIKSKGLLYVDLPQAAWEALGE